MSNIHLCSYTGSGKSSLGNAILANLGCFENPFNISSDVHSQGETTIIFTHESIKIFDHCGLSDSKQRDEELMKNSIKAFKSESSMNALLLVLNEQIPRFDNSMQDALKLIVDSLGVDVLKYTGIVFTRCFGNIKKESARKTSEQISNILCTRIGIKPIVLPFWQVDLFPEQLQAIGVPEYKIIEKQNERNQTLSEIIRWCKSNSNYSTSAMVAQLPEHKRQTQNLFENLKSLHIEDLKKQKEDLMNESKKELHNIRSDLEAVNIKLQTQNSELQRQLQEQQRQFQQQQEQQRQLQEQQRQLQEQQEQQRKADEQQRKVKEQEVKTKTENDIPPYYKWDLLTQEMKDGIAVLNLRNNYVGTVYSGAHTRSGLHFLKNNNFIPMRRPSDGKVYWTRETFNPRDHGALLNEFQDVTNNPLNSDYQYIKNRWDQSQKNRILYQNGHWIG